MEQGYENRAYQEMHNNGKPRSALEEMKQQLMLRKCLTVIVVVLGVSFVIAVAALIHTTTSNNPLPITQPVEAQQQKQDVSKDMMALQDRLQKLTDRLEAQFNLTGKRVDELITGMCVRFDNNMCVHLIKICVYI